jgi:hypothetical protein
MALTGEKDFFLAVDYKFCFSRNNKYCLRGGVVRVKTDRRARREFSAQDGIKTVVKFFEIDISVSAVKIFHASFFKFVKINH